MTLSRRSFLHRAAATSTAFTGLASLAACAPRGVDGYLNQAAGYGPLQRDRRGLIDLPRGFDYQILSETGDRMSDGLIVPGDPDGMAAFTDASGKIRLVRNHELMPDEPEKSAFGTRAERLSRIDETRIYDRAGDGLPYPGGTTTLVLDPESLRIEAQFLSLAGTANNCAGGPTPWNSWISCEETLVRRGEDAGVDHGYAFEVPAGANGLVEPQPLRGLGRFRHEAAAVDPVTGIVYQTEDDEPALFYRFIPDYPGELWRGGRLQALAIEGRPGADLRNWEESPSPVPAGRQLDVRWIDLEDIDNPQDDLAARAIAAGAARFTRGEGMWFGDRELYFCCTDGGPARIGQIWRYRPSRFEGYAQERSESGVLELFVETTDARRLEKCDNITIAPWGDLIVVEDGDADQFIRGVTPQGQIYTIGRNAQSDSDGEYSEITGPCFSPDGTTLFFNVQQAPGRTFAVRGPWPRRSLDLA